MRCASLTSCTSLSSLTSRGFVSNVDAIKTVAVLGAGTMGNGIAHVFARAGYKVILRDLEQRFLERAVDTIGKNLDREIKKGKLAEPEKGAVLGRLQATTDMKAIAAADFVVEAVPEKMEIKRAVLAEADGILRQEVIVASNTSSISMTTLAAMTKRPDRFVGMHFMNPVPVMALVEVIRALQTSDATFDTTMKLAEKLEKKPVAVNDAPGFVSNRVLMPLIDEAGDEPSDGAAGAGGLYWPGRLRGRYARAARRAWRSKVSRVPFAQEICGWGLARTQI